MIRLPWWLSGKESTCQWGRHGFDSWSRKISHTTEYWAHVPQLLSLCSGAQKLQLLEPVYFRVLFHSRRSHHNEQSTCRTREKANAATKIQHGPTETNKKRSDSFKKPSHVFKTEKVQTWIMSGYIVWKRPRCWERLKAGGEGDDRGWDGWMASPTQWIWVEEALGVGDGQGSLACCCPWGHKELNTTERLNWTDIVPRMPNLGPASLVAQMAKNLPQCWRRGSDPWFGKIPWRREWLSTVVFLPGEFHGQRSLVGYTHGVAKSQTRLRD